MSKKMIIINLSKTKMDSKSKLIINGKCDQVMKMVMKGLNLEPEKYNGPTVVQSSSHSTVISSPKSVIKRKIEENDLNEDLKQPKIESTL